MAKRGNGKTRPAPQARPQAPQQATPQTPISVPLGLVQLISSYINRSTGPVGDAMAIINQLQQAVDAAGYGRQAVQPKTTTPAPEQPED